MILKKRLLSLILLVALLVGVMCPIGAANDTGEKAEAGQGAIVYIPLDDRPLNLRRVQQLADSLDLQLILPDTDLYATKLDGQPKNANGTQFGDRGALMAWLMEQAEQYDTFIISLDFNVVNLACFIYCQDIQSYRTSLQVLYRILYLHT